MFQIRNALLALFVSTIALSAHSLEVGGEIPPLSVKEKGEYLLKGDDITFAPWSSASIKAGSPALIFHMPARMSADAVIAPLRERLDQEDYAEGSFQSISVVNLSEAMWGTSGLVASELAKNKRAHPLARIIADDKGMGPKAWNLEARETVIAVVNAEGKIIHLHKGNMSPEQVEKIISTLNAEIARSETLAKS